jgi:hypothetical protein
MQSPARAEGINLRDIQESILILVLLVNGAHQGSSWWQNLIDKDEDGLLWRELDTLSDDIYELSDRQVRWDKIFLLVDCGDVRLLDLFADDLWERKLARLRRRKRL